jgi:hypothetical protein
MLLNYGDGISLLRLGKRYHAAPGGHSASCDRFGTFRTKFLQKKPFNYVSMTGCHACVYTIRPWFVVIYRLTLGTIRFLSWPVDLICIYFIIGRQTKESSTCEWWSGYFPLKTNLLLLNPFGGSPVHAKPGKVERTKKGRIAPPLREITGLTTTPVCLPGRADRRRLSQPTRKINVIAD